MTKIEKSKSTAMLRSMSMGHHGKALLRKMDIDSLSTRERVFPSDNDDTYKFYNMDANEKSHDLDLSDSERRRKNRKKISVNEVKIQYKIIYALNHHF